MASKVEELRDKIVHDWWFEQAILDKVDSLIAAARAEGAEEQKQKKVQITCGVCGHTWEGVLVPVLAPKEKT